MYIIEFIRKKEKRGELFLLDQRGLTITSNPANTLT